MDKLLKCFEYLKPYHNDMLDTIGIIIELCALKVFKPESVSKLLLLDKHRIYTNLCDELKTIIEPELYIAPNSKINAQKILKMLESESITNDKIEQFLHIITQKKTTNKLYFYSTPCEINQLLVGILDIKDNDEIYNPCYGIGSVFLSLASITPNIALYGEELDSKLSHIAKLIAKLSQIQSTHLYVSDILAYPVFKDKNAYRLFDKILCNPPLNAYMGVEFLKDDERFSKVGILVKTYPELAFLTHSLAHLKTKGVFIVRNQTLLKSSLEGKMRERLCEERMIEAIIELPKNIFPHQSHDFSLLVISYDNDTILHINVNNPHFYCKDGKYNRIINVNEILQIYHQKLQTEYSTLTPIDTITTQDLRAHTYVNKLITPTSQSQTIESIGIEIFRGQRVSGDDRIDFVDIGIADFAPCGFTQDVQSTKHYGNIAKIKKYQIKPYDILLSLRGVVPKLAILGEINQICVVNAGIIVLRTKDRQSAIGLYCYLFSKQGEEALKQIYQDSHDSSINIQSLLALPLPQNYAKNAESMMQKLNIMRQKIFELQQEIEQLKE